MRRLHPERCLQILYPLALYYFVYHLGFLFFSMWLGRVCGALVCLMLAACVTIPPLYGYYRRLPVEKNPAFLEREQLGREAVGILATVLLGVLLNIVVAKTGLLEWSSGYQESQTTLSAGSPVVRMLANGLVIPILEELLYRGIICSQLDAWYGKKAAVVVAALLFGVMHFNVVQFLYAFLMGIALGILYLDGRKLWVAAAAHGLTNLVVVLYAVYG